MSLNPAVIGPRRRVRAVFAVLLTAFLVLTGLVAGSPAANAAETRTISGQVLFDARTSTELRGAVQIVVWGPLSPNSFNGPSLAYERVDYDSATGAFRIDELEPGRYRMTSQLDTPSGWWFSGAVAPGSDGVMSDFGLVLDVTAADASNVRFSFEDVRAGIQVTVRDWDDEQGILPVRAVITDVATRRETEGERGGSSLGWQMNTFTLAPDAPVTVRVEFSDGMVLYAAAGDAWSRDPAAAVPVSVGNWDGVSLTLFKADVPAPELTAPVPTISGTAKVGSKLTAKPGTWTSGAKLTYQWLADGKAIKGATAVTFTPTAAEAGKKLTVAVTGSKAGYATKTTTSKATAAVAKATLQSATPTISGTVKVGSTLTAKPGTWTSGAKLAYQWLAGGTAIKGATASTYVPMAADLGKTLTVKVTGALSGYETAAKTSKATAAVAKGTLKTATPTISGTVKVGSKLTAKPGTWTSGAKLAYQWLADGKAIKGATASTYVLKAADLGKKLTVKVTGALSGYETTAKTSKATAAVAKGALKTATPTISGTAKVGSTLKAKPGTWTSGAKLTYQWLADGKAIKGATAQSYKATAAVAGKKLTVKVTGSLAGYTSAAKTSAATAKVAKK